MKIIDITDKYYPKRLLNIKNPPQKLYVKGNYKLLNNQSLAIVGSRRCSQYGVKYAQKFAKEICSKNITIISGLALGIDAVAHEIAKDCIGNTIGVLGCGINQVFPEENRYLFDEILKNDGCIISEYGPDEEINKQNFPKRNRIISGISNAILVVEAGYRSGSTITGKYGLEQKKNVYCIPRDLGITNGIGTNDLIKLGAKLVTNSEDILEEFIIKEPEGKISKQKQEDVIENDDIENVQIEKEYLEIYNLILYKPINIQQLVKKSGLNISKLNQKLTILELEGHIKNLPGNNYVRV